MDRSGRSAGRNPRRRRQHAGGYEARWKRRGLTARKPSHLAKLLRLGSPTQGVKNCRTHVAARSRTGASLLIALLWWFGGPIHRIAFLQRRGAERLAGAFVLKSEWPARGARFSTTTSQKTEKPVAEHKQQGSGKHPHKDTEEPWHHTKGSEHGRSSHSSSSSGHSGSSGQHASSGQQSSSRHGGSGSEGHGLKAREYRDEQGNIRHHTKSYEQQHGKK